MRVGFPGAPRLEWYDRNPVTIARAYEAGNVAPHASTDRWTYTVPAGKKAFIESLMIMILRNLAPTTSGTVQAIISWTPQGGNAQQILQAYFNSATVGAADNRQQGHSGVLSTGDVLTGKTADLSTGGQCGYVVNAKITEFDA